MEKTDNEIIAEFMGDRDKILCDPKWMKGDELVYLRYHLSWDWLMPVVEKIYDYADTNVREINNEGLAIFELGISAPIEDVCDAVVKYVKWYNSQSPNKQLKV